MVATARLFLDTYAMIEIIRGNPAYKKYVGGEFATLYTNLLELYHALLRDFDAAIAGRCLEVYQPHMVPLELDWIAPAAEMKLRRKVSYGDALGYIAARSLGVPFLTGDDAFRGETGVEFVK